jgi:hypothetical protein
MNARKSCPNFEINLKDCGCTYTTCERRGKCCECIRHHVERNEFPGCLFPPEIERTYDRSIEKFVSTHSG